MLFSPPDQIPSCQLLQDTSVRRNENTSCPTVAIETAQVGSVVMPVNKLRRVSEMDPTKAEHKRHMDREAQRRNRERTRTRIQDLEAEVERLKRELGVVSNNGWSLNHYAEELKRSNAKLRLEVSRLCTELANANRNGSIENNLFDYVRKGPGIDPGADLTMHSGSVSTSRPQRGTRDHALPNQPMPLALGDARTQSNQSLCSRQNALRAGTDGTIPMPRMQYEKRVHTHKDVVMFPTSPWPRPDVAPMEPPLTPFSPPNYIPCLQSTNPRQVDPQSQRLPPIIQDYPEPGRNIDPQTLTQQFQTFGRDQRSRGLMRSVDKSDDISTQSSS